MSDCDVDEIVNEQQAEDHLIDCGHIEPIEHLDKIIDTQTQIVMSDKPASLMVVIAKAGLCAFGYLPFYTAGNICWTIGVLGTLGGLLYTVTRLASLSSFTLTNTAHAWLFVFTLIALYHLLSLAQCLCQYSRIERVLLQLNQLPCRFNQSRLCAVLCAILILHLGLFVSVECLSCWHSTGVLLSWWQRIVDVMSSVWFVYAMPRQLVAVLVYVAVCEHLTHQFTGLQQQLLSFKRSGLTKILNKKQRRNSRPESGNQSTMANLWMQYDQLNEVFGELDQISSSVCLWNVLLCLLMVLVRCFTIISPRAHAHTWRTPDPFWRELLARVYDLELLLHATLVFVLTFAAAIRLNEARRSVHLAVIGVSVEAHNQHYIDLFYKSWLNGALSMTFGKVFKATRLSFFVISLGSLVLVLTWLHVKAPPVKLVLTASDLDHYDFIQTNRQPLLNDD